MHVPKSINNTPSLAYFRGRHSVCILRSYYTFSQPCTAYQSECFQALFRTPTPLQPPPSLVVSNTTIPFEKVFHGSYSLRMFLPTSHLLCSLRTHVAQKPITLYNNVQMPCCKIFVLKYFCRTSTL